jgi:hypothetical protein
MARDERLAETQRGLEISDTKAPVRQNVHNPEAVGIGKSSEQPRNLGHFALRIYGYADVLPSSPIFDVTRCPNPANLRISNATLSHQRAGR